MKRIFYNPLYDSDAELTLVGCGYEKCNSEFLDGPGIRNSYILHYIVSGKGYYETGEQKHALKKGDVFAIYPDDLVTYYADKDDPWELCWIIFKGTHAHKYYNNIGISHSSLVIHNVDKAFAACITDCLKYIDENERTCSQLRLVSCILECLSHIDKATYAERNPTLIKAMFKTRFLILNIITDEESVSMTFQITFVLIAPTFTEYLKKKQAKHQTSI